ncbi:MAG: hypothetical protein Q9184_005088 [Pyrenodesmia sp. 2 TL-2023]
MPPAGAVLVKSWRGRCEDLAKKCGWLESRVGELEEQVEGLEEQVEYLQQQLQWERRGREEVGRWVDEVADADAEWVREQALLSDKEMLDAQWEREMWVWEMQLGVEEQEMGVQAMREEMAAEAGDEMSEEVGSDEGTSLEGGNWEASEA